MNEQSTDICTVSELRPLLDTQIVIIIEINSITEKQKILHQLTVKHQVVSYVPRPHGPSLG